MVWLEERSVGAMYYCHDGLLVVQFWLGVFLAKGLVKVEAGDLGGDGGSFR